MDMFNQPKAWDSCLLCERDHLQSEVERHLELLRKVRSQIGWRGDGQNAIEDYYCEHCQATHEDGDLIDHTTDCLVRELDDALTDEEQDHG